MKNKKLLVAFDISGKNAMLRRQVEQLSRELKTHFRIFENLDSKRNLMLAAENACLEGYEELFILTEEGRVVEVEQLIRGQDFFKSVQAIPEASYRYLSTKREQGPLKILTEVGPAAPGPVAPAVKTGTAPNVLVVTFLNANPMVKGHAALITEALQKDVTKDMATYNLLPNFKAQSGWPTSGKIFRYIYLTPSDTTSHCPLPSPTRVDLLVGDETVTGLYGEKGVSPTKLFSPLQSASILQGSKGVPLGKTIQEAKLSLDAVSNMVIYAPKDQVAKVVASLGAQTEYNAADGYQITVLPLAAIDVDTPNDSLVSTANVIADACLYDEKKAAEPAKKEAVQALDKSDYFACTLITTLHAVKTGKIDINMKGNPPGTKSVSDYLHNLWKALPPGDRELAADISKNTGLQDLIDVGKSAAKLGGAVAGLKKASPEDLKTIESLAKLKSAFAIMGYDLIAMINHPSYKGFKDKLDV